MTILCYTINSIESMVFLYVEKEVVMSNSTQPPVKVFEVRSIVNDFTNFLFFLDGDNIIVQTNDIELGNTLKDFSGKVQSLTKLLVDLITGVNPLHIEFLSKEKSFTLTILQPIIKQLEEGV